MLKMIFWFIDSDNATITYFLRVFDKQGFSPPFITMSEIFPTSTLLGISPPNFLIGKNKARIIK